MEYSITWGGDPEDVCITTRGVASLLDVDAMLREASANARWHAGLKVLFDHTRSDWNALPVGELTELTALVRNLDQELGQQRIAAVFREPESFRAARLVGNQLDGEVPWVGHVFGSMAEAREWLREPSDQRLPHVQPRW
jgi:hypothetical protein